MLFRSLCENNLAGTRATYSGHQLESTGGEAVVTEVLVRTNTSSQIAAISNVANNLLCIRTVGWFDNRGSQ